MPPERIGVRDDLFRIGVNSMSAIKLVARLRTEPRLEVSIALLFTHPSIAELASAILAGPAAREEHGER